MVFWFGLLGLFMNFIEAIFGCKVITNTSHVMDEIINQGSGFNCGMSLRGLAWSPMLA